MRPNFLPRGWNPRNSVSVKSRQAHSDLLTSQEREEIRKLRRENYELRRANEILKSASLFFARELDPDRPK
jgi:transposase